MARSARLNNEELGLSLFTIDEGRITVEPFADETHSTVYVTRIEAQCDATMKIESINIIN